MTILNLSKIPIRGSLAFFLEEAAFLDIQMPGEGFPRILVPDGRPTLLVNLSESEYGFEDKSHYLEPLSAKLLPVHSRPIRLTMGPRCKFLYFRFFPYGLHYLFGIRGAKMGEGLLDPTDIAGECIRSILGRLPNPSKDSLLIESILSKMEELSLRAMRPHPRIREACLQIRNYQGRIAVEKICQGSLAEYKALQRCFQEYIELSPKLFARMVRFEAIMEHLRQKPESDWFDLIAIFGLHDQSHLIREFRFFTGHTPGEFIRGGVDGFI